MVALLLVLLGALPEPRYVEDGLTLMQSEQVWLLEERVRYEREQLRRVEQIGERVSGREVDIARLEAARDAAASQTAKDAITAQIAKIRDGAIELGKLKIAELATVARPSAVDARRRTLERVYNPENGQVRHDPNADGTVSRPESGWPAFLFNAVDGDSDGALTAAELAAYYDGLDRE